MIHAVIENERPAARKHTGILPWLMCFLAAFFYSYEFFLRVAPSVMMGSIMSHYQIYAAQFGVLSAFYYYAYTPMQLFVGPLIDMHGVRKLITFACFLCVLGTYLFIATPYLWVAEMGRFLTGFGSAFAFTGVLKLAADWLPPRYLALVSGTTTTLGMLGAILGESFLAQLNVAVGEMRAVYLILLVGVLLTVALGLCVRDHDPVDKVSLKQEEFSKLIQNLINVGKTGQIWINGVIGGLIFMPTSVFAVLWGVPYLQQVYHVSTQQAANMTTMIFLGWALASPLAGWLSDWLKTRQKLLLLSTTLSSGLLTFFFYGPQLSPGYVSLLLLLFGVMCSPQVLVFPIGCENAPHRLAGTAVAFTNMLVMIGGFVFPPIIGLLLDATWDGTLVNHIPVYSAWSYKIAFSIMPLGLFVSVILCFFLRDTRCQQQVK